MSAVKPMDGEATSMKSGTSPAKDGSTSGSFLNRERSEVGMTETVILLCVFGIAEVVCIIGLIVIYFREKKVERETGKKITYRSPIGDWLCGKRW